MKISVIVPVYKAEDYLRECVDSILAQTMSDLEIILVNDGSPDNSQLIIAEYVSAYPDKVKAIAVENGGQGRARNFGIDMARGDYLSFIDSDDYLEADAFEIMLKAADENDADIVVCDMEKRWDSGKSEYVKAALQNHPLASAGSSSNKIFRRSLVGSIRFPVGVWYEDFEFSAKLLMLSGKTVFVDKPLYIYRCGQESTMNNNNSEKNLDIITVMENIKTFSETCLDRDGYEFMLLNHVLLESIKRTAMQSGKEKRKIIKTLRSYVRENIPSLNACKSYRSESRNRRIIMRLNYYGFENISLALLKLKNGN